VFSRFMISFLSDMGISAHVWVIEQADDLPFNRGQLLNIGFLESRSSSEYAAYHDIDHLPGDAMDYSFFRGVTELHPYQDGYAMSCGGVTVIDHESFSKINGYGTQFWGWGGEDDSLCARISRNKVPWRTQEGSANNWVGLRHKSLVEEGKWDELLHRMNIQSFYDDIPTRVAGVHQQQYEVLGREEHRYYTKVSVKLFENERLRQYYVAKQILAESGANDVPRPAR